MAERDHTWRTVVAALVVLAAVSATGFGLVATTAGVSAAQTTGPTVEWAVASHGTVYVRFSTPIDPASVDDGDLQLAGDRAPTVAPNVSDDDGDDLLVLDGGPVVVPGQRPVIGVGNVSSTDGSANAPGTGPVSTLGVALVQGAVNDSGANPATAHRGELVTFRASGPNVTVRLVNDDNGSTVFERSTGSDGLFTIDTRTIPAGTLYRAEFGTGSSAQYLSVVQSQVAGDVTPDVVEVPGTATHAGGVPQSETILQFELVRPDGSVAGRTVTTVDSTGVGGGETTVPSPGRYRFRVRSLATGRTALTSTFLGVQGVVVREADSTSTSDPAVVHYGDAIAVQSDAPNASVPITRAGNTTVVTVLDTGPDAVATLTSTELQPGVVYRAAYPDGTNQYVAVDVFRLGVAVEDGTFRADEPIPVRAQAIRGDSPVRLQLLADNGTVVDAQQQGWGDGDVNATLSAPSNGTYQARVIDVGTGATATSDPVTVEPGLASLNGVVPRDVDGDGIHEDLNGNGEFDSDDVVTFFQTIEQPALQDHPDAYDVNGNGQVDFDDLVQLFQQL